MDDDIFVEPQPTLISIIFDLGSVLLCQLEQPVKIAQMFALTPYFSIPNEIFNSALILEIVNFFCTCSSQLSFRVLRKVISSIYHIYIKFKYI